MDDILAGGLPAERLYLIYGSPGVGKTTLAMQFLLEGVRRGEECLYITLSETKEEMESVAHSHGWDLSGLHLFELAAMAEKLQDTGSTFFRPSDVELNRTTQTLLAEVDRIQPKRVVFDSLSELRLLAETPLRYRRQILQFKQFFAGRSATVLFLDDQTTGANDLHIESIAHGVISLQRTEPDYGIARRTISVVKLRGSHFREGKHDFVMRRGGIAVFPRLVAAEHRVSPIDGSVQCGVSQLDSLLGGGIDRGTSNVFMGPAGAGKSTVALKFAIAAAARGEKTQFYIFDETYNTFLVRAGKLGMDLRKAMEEGLIEVQQIDPAEISPGELAHRIRESVAVGKARMIVVDSINGYLQAMPGERFLTLQLHELLSYLNQQGVVTILTVAQQGLIGAMQTVVDLTYLADTVLLLRFFEARGEVRQAISVIKKRSSNHERSIREMKIVESVGIEVGEPLQSMHGVLTGVPNLIGFGPDLASAGR